ncbi:hypothetical protein HMPREF9129_2163 [Peptoniphilus indolicus ATCC 29427]|uniref:Uncharacterized protein n=1 Tax=Peptoniphilus indolicus ATCC 29427 TaxID=997350 RepID=G4D6Y3_9FIRM|nr:hypothetical protein HMPREF9129_2163 [Peptoniphilus indolicus ATCC 29427]
MVNLVQENPKTFYADAKFIPYIDNNVDSLYLRPLSNMAEQEIEINKKLNTFVEDSENINLYQVCLVTSIENFQKIIKKSEQAFVEKGIEFPRIYYELNMKFSDKNIEEYSKRIEDIMENTVLNDEKYIVNNKIQQMKLNKLNEQSVYFIGVLSIVSVVFLNIANSYASTNLSFFNREKEIGVLLSNGMYVVDLEKNLLKDMKKNIIKSVFIATLIANALFGSLLTTIPYISIKKYISIFPFMIIFLIVIIIISFSYIIYYFAMKKITNKSIVELIR